MKLLDRYIAKTILASIALVTLLLAGLELFILFVNQLDELGKAHYGLLEALAFISMQLPDQVYLFFPMASLLGSLIGLGMLANHRELIVMRAAGFSIWEVAFAVLKAAMVVIMVVTVVGELFVPTLVQFANNKKMEALSDGQTLKTAVGTWFRYNNDFIAVGIIVSPRQLEQVYQFRFDPSHHLQLARKINHIVFQQGQWWAYDVGETRFYPSSTRVQTMAKEKWDVHIKPSILKVSSREPDEMTLVQLHDYLHTQKKHHQSALNYQLAYWQRLIQPLTTMVMMMLAIPFIFGPLRSSTMGAKLLAGATVGFGFHIVNRFFGPVSQMLQWPSFVAALGPTCFCALLGLYLMKRVK